MDKSRKVTSKRTWDVKCMYIKFAGNMSKIANLYKEDTCTFQIT